MTPTVRETCRDFVRKQRLPHPVRQLPWADFGRVASGSLARRRCFFSGAHQGHRGTVNRQNQQELVGTQNPGITTKTIRIRWNG